MKKIFFLIFTTLFLLKSSLIFSQAPPQGISYQAIARDTTGKPISGATIKVKFSIYDQLVGGVLFFSEVHPAVSTNRYGLFTRIIGSVDTAAFSAIPWAVGSKFLEVAIDSGNSGFVTMPRTQMISVPYALYARVSGGNWSLLGDAVNSNNFIGTTNLQPFVIKMNNIERMRVGLNGNVGIGTTNPGAGLVVAGGSAEIGLQNTFGGTEWRIASAGNGTLNFIKFPGTPFVAMTIDSLNGYVGIGTVTPGAKLEVNGQVKITDGTQGLGKVLTSNANGLASWLLPASSSSYWTASGADIYNNNSGNVGIGINSPLYRLHVFGNSTLLDPNSAILPALIIKGDWSAIQHVNSSGTVAWYSGLRSDDGGAADDYSFWSPSALFMMTLTQSGRVGIGTATPDGELEVVSTSATTPRGIIGTEYNNNPIIDSHLSLRRARGAEGSPLAIQANDEIGSVKFRGYTGTAFPTNDQTQIDAIASQPFTASHNGSFLRFMTTPNGTIIGQERMRIDHNGQIGIGTTTPTALLDIAGTTNITGGNTSELNRTQTGSANLVPIAFASISANASTVNASTGNVSVNWNSTNNNYEVTITGETYTNSNYVTMVTAIGSSSNVKVETTASAGKLIVTIHAGDLGGTNIQNAFQFITYKP
jgi:hypothetical protein